MTEKNHLHSREASIDSPYLSMVSRFIENIAAKVSLMPVLTEFRGFPQEHHHGMMTAAVYNGVIGRWLMDRLVTQADLPLFNLGALAVLLHDIGKLGVDPRGIRASLAVFYENPRTDQQLGGVDLRLPHQRAVQHLHPLVGGFFFQAMAEEQLITPQTAGVLSLVSFSHHEQHNPHKTAYPRNHDRNNSFGQTLLVFLCSLADMAVACREHRPYRHYPLGWDIIANELDGYLPDDRLDNLIRGGNWPLSTDDLRKKIIKDVLAATQTVDNMIRTRLDDNIIENPSLISRLIGRVWEVHGERLTQSYWFYLAHPYYHTSRTG